jgi:putative ABC transport system ATP-binding protein
LRVVAVGCIRSARLTLHPLTEEALGDGERFLLRLPTVAALRVRPAVPSGIPASRLVGRFGGVQYRSMIVSEETNRSKAEDGAASPAARAIDLGKAYGRGEVVVRALDGVSVEFERARFTAVMGPSGSGKSTLMHCMAGLDVPSSGCAFVGEDELGLLDDAGLTDLRRDRIGFVFQSFNLVPTLSAGENITLPVDLAGARVDRAWFDYLVEALGIADRVSHRPRELSGGQQQRVACAGALIRRPELVFADEPTGNLDSGSSAEVLTFLRRSVREQGQSIVMVTHDPLGAAYADRVVFLADGRLVGELRSPTADSILERMRKLRR